MMEAATLCDAGCNPMGCRLQPDVMEAAAICDERCDGGCNRVGSLREHELLERVQTVGGQVEGAAALGAARPHRAARRGAHRAEGAGGLPGQENLPLPLPHTVAPPAARGCSLCLLRAAASAAWGCSLHHMRLQPPSHRVAGLQGCRLLQQLRGMGLQPLLREVAASIT